MINNKQLLIPLLAFLSLTTISGALLTSSFVSADNNSVVEEINITVPVSCTLSGTGMDSHNANINNGTYNSAIGETTLKAFCNDNEGFAIYAIGYTDNEDGNNVLTNSTLGSDYDIVTGTATSGNTSNWAMKLSTITSPTPTYPIIIAGTNEDTLKEQGDPDYSTFQEVPDNYTKVAYRTSSTDIGTNAEGATFKTTYQAYISPTQPAGTYTGQVKYTLVYPHDSAAPKKPLACNPSGTTISTIVCMQDISSTNKTSILSSMTTGEQYQLYDIRDEKQYYVAKQADGNIWMTQNLDLCVGCEGVATLTSKNTDLNVFGSGKYTNGYTESNGVITWTPANTAITSNSMVTEGTIEGLYYSEQYPYSAEGGDVFVYTSGNDNNDTIYNSESDCTSAHNDGTCAHYHVGNYYNKTVAAASNNILDNGDHLGDYSPAENSICPAGWRLPLLRKWDTASSSYISYNEFGKLLYESGITETDGLSSYYALYTTGGFNNIRSAPLFLVRAGSTSFALYSRGSSGDYQSASEKYLSFWSGETMPNYEFASDGDYGYTVPIRCLVR